MPVCSECWVSGECHGYCRGKLPVVTDLGPTYYAWRISAPGKAAARELKRIGFSVENRRMVERKYWTPTT